MATEADVRERVAETFKEEKDREMLTEASNVVVEKSEGIAEPLPKFEAQVTKGVIEVNGKNTEGEFIYESPLVTKVADEQILSPPELNEDAVVLNQTETKFLESSVGKESEKNRDEIISTINENSTEEIQHISKETSSGSSQITEGKFFEPDLAEEMKVLEPASSKEDVGEVTISEEGLGHTILKESENVNTDPEEMKSRGDMKDEDSNKETMPCDATGNANLKSENASDQKEEATEICENGNRNLDISSTVTPVEEKCIADAGSDNTFSEAIGSSDALENEHIVEAEASTGKPLSSSAVEPKYVTHHTEAKLDSEVDLASTEASDRSKVADEVQTEVEEPGKFKNDENFPDSEAIQINPEEPLYATPDKIDVSETCQNTETTTTVINLPEALKEATNDETLDAHYTPEKQTEDISTNDLKKEDKDILSNTVQDLQSTHPLVDETKQERVLEENQVHITEPMDVRDAHEANSIPECNTIVQTSDKESLNEMQDESAIAAKDKECEAEETSEAETGQYVHEIPSSDSQSIENEKSVETGAEKTFTDDHSLSLQSPNKDVDSVGKEYSEASHVESEKVEKILEPATEVHFSEVSYEIEESGTKGESLEAAVPESGVEKIPNKETNEANGTTENYISSDKNISTVDLNEDEDGDISCNTANDLHSTPPLVEETKHEQACSHKEESNTPELRFTSFEEIQDESGIEAKEKESEAEETSKVQLERSVPEIQVSECQSAGNDESVENGAEKSFTDEQSLISESSKKDVEDLAISNSTENEVLPEEAGKEHTEASHAESEHLEKILDLATPVLYSDYEAEGNGIKEESLEAPITEIGAEKILNEDTNEAKGITESYISSEKNITTVDLNDEEDVDTPCYTPKDIQHTVPLVEETKQEQVREENEVPIEELKHMHEAISIPESSTINQTLTEGESDIDLTSTNQVNAGNLEAECKVNFADKLQTDADNNTEDRLQQHGEACEEQDHETPDAAENTTHQSETNSDAPSVTISEEAGLEGESLQKEESSTSELCFKSFEEMKDGNGNEVKEREYKAEETSEVQPPQDVHETQFSVENDKSVETGAEKIFTDDHSSSLQTSKKDVGNLGNSLQIAEEIQPVNASKEYSEASHVESEKEEKILEPATEVHYSEVSYGIEESGTKGESIEAATPESEVEKIPNKQTNEANGTTENYISSEKNIPTVDLNDDENGDISYNAAKDLHSTLPLVEETKQEQVFEENTIHESETDVDLSSVASSEKACLQKEDSNTPELRFNSFEEIQDESGIEAKEKENQAEETSEVQLERSVPEIHVSECQSVGNVESVENGAEKISTDEQSLISESSKKDVEDSAISYSTENAVLPEEAGKEYTEASHAETEHLEKILDLATPVLYSDYEAEESGIKDESLEATTTEIEAEKLRNEETNEAKVTTESYIYTEDQLQQHGEACEEQDHETPDAVENTTHQNETTSYAPSVTISEEAGLEGASLKKEESSISELPFKSFEEIEDGNGTEVKAREYEAEETYEVQPPQDVHETQFSDSQSVGNDESVETEEAKTLTDDKCLSAESSKKNDDELTIPYPTEKEILPEEVGKEFDEAPPVESVTRVHHSEVPSELKESEMKEELLEAATPEKAITEEELPSITTHVLSDTAKSDDQCEVSKDQEVLSSEVVSLHPNKDIEVNDREYSVEEKSQAHNPNISDSSLVDIPGAKGLENAVSEADDEGLLHKSTNESVISEISNKEVAITADDNSSESLIDNEKPDTKPVETACEEKEATEKSLPTMKADDKELETYEAKDEEEEREVTPMVERDLVDVTSDKIITEVEIKEDNSNVVQGDRKESTETAISSEDKHIHSDSVTGTVALEIDEPRPVDSSEAAGSNINEDAKECIEDQTPDSFELANSINNEEAIEKNEDQATEIFEAARNDNNEEVTEHNEDQAKVVATSDSETNREESDSPSSITEGEDPKIHDRDVKLENLSPPDQSNTDICQIDEHLDLATPTEIAPDSIELQNASLATKETGILEEPQTIESIEVTTISAGKDVELLQKDPEATIIHDEVQKPKTENETDAASEIATVESEAKDASDEIKEMEEESSIKQAPYSEPDLTQGSINTTLSVADERETLDQLPEDHVPEHVHLVQNDSSESAEPMISSEEKDTLLEQPVPVTGTVTREIEEIMHANASETEAKAEAENTECGEERKTIHDYNQIPESSQSTDSTESAPSDLLQESADETIQKVGEIVSETLPPAHLLPSHDQKEPEADPKVTIDLENSTSDDKGVPPMEEEASTEIVQAGGEISKCAEQSFEETRSEEEQRTKDEINQATVKSLPTAALEEETREIIEHTSERSEQIAKNEELHTENAERDEDRKLKSDKSKDEEEEGMVQSEEKTCSEVPIVAERDLIDGTSNEIIAEVETKEDGYSAVLHGKISEQVDTEESIETVVSNEDKHIQSDSRAGTVGHEIDESKHADSSEVAGSNKSEEAKEIYEGQAIDSSDAAESNESEGLKENNEEQVTVEARGSETKQNEDDTQSNITEGDDLKIHVPDVKVENLSPPEQSSTNIREIDEPLVLAKPTEIAPDTTELDKISLSPKENENPEEPPSSECADVTIASHDIDVQPLQNDVSDAASEAAGIEPEATGTTDESKETEHESTAIETTKNSEADVVQGSENLTLSVAEEKETLAQPVEDNVYLGVQGLKTGTIQKEEQVNLSSDESIREEVNESRSFEVPANKIQSQKDPEESPEPVLCSGHVDIPRTEEAKGEEVPKVADEINEPATKIADNSATFEEEILVVPENAERFEDQDVKTGEGEVQRGENSGFEIPLVSGKDSVDLTNNKIITAEVKEDNSIVVPERTIPAQGEPEENTETLISTEVPFVVTRAVNLENEELKHVNASEPAAVTESLECEEDTKATRDYNELPESSKSIEPSENSPYENLQASAKVTPVEAEAFESQDPESLHVPPQNKSSSIENSTKDGASDINITPDKQEPEASPLLASSEHIVLEADQKVTPEPENSECVPQVQQEANSESYQKDPEPANIEEEKKEATEKSLPTETTTSSITTLSEKADHVNEAIKVVPEKEELQVKIAETDEKEEGENSGSDAPVIVEASRDIETKVSPKKSNNILSGVGSKVKHSIAKVKKAITGSGKHSHSKESKPTSPK